MRADRRGLLGVAGALLLSGCDRVSASDWVQGLLASAEGLDRRVQRWLVSRRALAAEYTEADISPMFRANGTDSPDTPEYQAHAAAGFSDWQLEVAGLVERPLRLSLEALRALPSRTQITRHDCVEGWSCIGKWKGVPLQLVLDRAGMKPAARYVVFRCADRMAGAFGAAEPYYESIDLEDAAHPQTILAYDMNDQPLPIANGAPLRLRVERQLGYKMAKYVMRIEVVDSLAGIGQGKGGYWEDHGYAWYAGI